MFLNVNLNVESSLSQSLKFAMKHNAFLVTVISDVTPLYPGAHPQFSSDVEPGSLVFPVSHAVQDDIPSSL